MLVLPFLAMFCDFLSTRHKTPNNISRASTKFLSDVCIVMFYVLIRFFFKDIAQFSIFLHLPLCLFFLFVLPPLPVPCPVQCLSAKVVPHCVPSNTPSIVRLSSSFPPSLPPFSFILHPSPFASARRVSFQSNPISIPDTISIIPPPLFHYLPTSRCIYLWLTPEFAQFFHSFKSAPVLQDIIAHLKLKFRIFLMATR